MTRSGGRREAVEPGRAATRAAPTSSFCLRTWLCHSRESVGLLGGFVPVSSSETVSQGLSCGYAGKFSSVGAALVATDSDRAASTFIASSSGRSKSSSNPVYDVAEGVIVVDAMSDPVYGVAEGVFVVGAMSDGAEVVDAI